ncbi:CHRD domain-containing protein [Dyadobacter jejuensis]|uniref:CHRD domain-containing protein n=1 Tax=Dyadobacter jejuensis TaxID=1082580 RepID=A0A316AK64_9BACT|nr:CHRD domain-containing protein [Dyadobacter jejuensis]PWJ57758.1 CHRD domain-containing protein [Dyadobacter jejuensis]
MRSNFSIFLTLFLLIGIVVSCTQDHHIPMQYSQKGLKITGYQENPGVNTQAWGTADVTYDKGTKKLSYTLNWNNLTGIPSGAHIHGVAARGINAGVVHNFGAMIPAAVTGTYSGMVTVDEIAIKEADLLNGLYYFNFHTPTNPGGEIRGQIEFYDPMKVITKMDQPLNAAQEVPAGASTATGLMDVVYNKTTKMLSLTVWYQGLTGTPTGAHIHGVAAAGVNAGVQVNMSTLIPMATMGAFSHTVLVDETAIKEADLLAGRYYVNIHTAMNPGGEIRGQITF